MRNAGKEMNCFVSWQGRDSHDERYPWWGCCEAFHYLPQWAGHEFVHEDRTRTLSQGEVLEQPEGVRVPMTNWHVSDALLMVQVFRLTKVQSWVSFRETCSVQHCQNGCCFLNWFVENTISLVGMHNMYVCVSQDTEKSWKWNLFVTLSWSRAVVHLIESSMLKV